MYLEKYITLKLSLKADFKNVIKTTKMSQISF